MIEVYVFDEVNLFRCYAYNISHDAESHRCLKTNRLIWYARLVEKISLIDSICSAYLLLKGHRGMST